MLSLSEHLSNFSIEYDSLVIEDNPVGYSVFVKQDDVYTGYIGVDDEGHNVLLIEPSDLFPSDVPPYGKPVAYGYGLGLHQACFTLVYRLREREYKNRVLSLGDALDTYEPYK